jgi:hypothetical protein
MSLYDRFLQMNPWTRFIVFALLGALLSQFWTYTRSHHRVPRSVCLIEDETHGVCKTWALYDLRKLKSGQEANIAGHSDRCVRSGGRAQFGAQMNDGGLVFTCVHE